MNHVPLTILVTAGAIGELLGSLPAGLVVGGVLNMVFTILGARQVRKTES